MWATVCGAVGGAAIIHRDGVDFNLLEPTALAIAMFIAIPAGGGWLMAYFIDRWQPWWARDRRKTAIASVAVVPVFLAGVGIVPGAVIVAVALVAILSQVGSLRTVARHVAIAHRGVPRARRAHGVRARRPHRRRAHAVVS